MSRVFALTHTNPYVLPSQRGTHTQYGGLRWLILTLWPFGIEPQPMSYEFLSQFSKGEKRDERRGHCIICLQITSFCCHFFHKQSGFWRIYGYKPHYSDHPVTSMPKMFREREILRLELCEQYQGLPPQSVTGKKRRRFKTFFCFLSHKNLSCKKKTKKLIMDLNIVWW